MILQLGDVVADVVNQREAGFPGADLQHLLEGPPHAAGDHLPVGKGEVGGGAHRPQVALPFLRPERRAAELAVRERDPVLGGRTDHLGDEVVADLVAQTAGTGVDDHRDGVQLQTEDAGRDLVVNLGHVPDLHEVVARAERSELAAPPLQGPIGNQIGPRSGEAPSLLDVVQVGGAAEPPRHRPAGALRQHLPELPDLQPQVFPLGADAGRNIVEQPLHQLLHPGLEGFPAQAGAQEPDPAIDVIADSSGRNHAVLGIEGGDSADGKAVAPVNIRHREGGPDDARQVGHVDHLLQAHGIDHVPHHFFIGVDDSRHPHARDRADLVTAFVQLGQRRSLNLVRGNLLTGRK